MGENETKIEAEIKEIRKILERNLTIPEFQRPYCWDKENVRLLLQDVYDSWENKKESYVIGSTILYKEDFNDFQIVDGQQRITTFFLILRWLLKEDKYFIEENLYSKEVKELKQQIEKLYSSSTNFIYKHEESQKHIIENYKFVGQWIKKKTTTEEKLNFYKYLVENCKFVEIVVKDLSEAFQMFDSQNGRGKEIEPYNLLKAYHIRTMEGETEETKKDCDIRWERATRYINEKKKEQDLLKQVIGKQLYYTRKWSRKEEVDKQDKGLTKSDIKEFKGSISINKKNTIKFPFQNVQLLQYIAKNYFESIGWKVTQFKQRFINGDSDNINPLVLINHNIINGKHFFDYVETYIEIYKQLFISSEDESFEEPLKKFKKYYSKYCCKYTGAYNSGDTYLKEVYKSLIFIVFDKYGEKGVKEWYDYLYVLIYRYRLEYERILFKKVTENTSKYFSHIENSTNLDDINMLLYEQIPKKIKCYYTEKEITDLEASPVKITMRKIIPAFCNLDISIVDKSGDTIKLNDE